MDRKRPARERNQYERLIRWKKELDEMAYMLGHSRSTFQHRGFELTADEMRVRVEDARSWLEELIFLFETEVL